MEKDSGERGEAVGGICVAAVIGRWNMQDHSKPFIQKLPQLINWDAALISIGGEL